MSKSRIWVVPLVKPRMAAFLGVSIHGDPADQVREQDETDKPNAHCKERGFVRVMLYSITRANFSDSAPRESAEQPGRHTSLVWANVVSSDDGARDTILASIPAPLDVSPALPALAAFQPLVPRHEDQERQRNFSPTRLNDPGVFHELCFTTRSAAVEMRPPSRTAAAGPGPT